MAVAAPAARARETVRQKRERDQELLVWPDLVFVEFICAVLFTITFVVLATFFDAPLLNKANPNVTPNPSKAPWYFMNLQELLLHMDKGLAGVIVPTILLIGLMAIPYVDRDNEGQGSWFGTINSVRITVFSFFWSSIWISWLILWDNGSHVLVYQHLPQLWGSNTRLQWLGDKNPFAGWPVEGALKPIWDFIFLRNRLAIRDTWSWSLPVPFQPGSGPHDGRLDWPQDFTRIPLPLNGTWLWHWAQPGWMPGWMLHVYWYKSTFSLPAITAEWAVPILAMLGLPALMIIILRKIGWAHTMRDAIIALFTGFIVVYFALTIVGAAFRGKGQQLVPPYRVPNLNDDPAIQRQVPLSPSQFVVVDARTPGSGIYG
ncbi:MAG: hypothetical protein IVW36_12095 [Dehalococcoidia bacterium]|nr:hypothetical protein [Dehalococcoidia bacterium]